MVNRISYHVTLHINDLDFFFIFLTKWFFWLCFRLNRLGAFSLKCISVRFRSVRFRSVLFFGDLFAGYLFVGCVLLVYRPDLQWCQHYTHVLVVILVSHSLLSMDNPIEWWIKEQVPSIVPHLIIAGNRSWFVPRVLLYKKQQSFFTVANMTMAQEFFVAVSFSWILVISAQATQRRLFTIILKWGTLF